ncbi:MAG: penicillin-binding transpeptidase domain-containing protein [Desulfobacterales bacterium]|jgi:cell division protein FtsI/penicillin-binding protein 2
MRLNREGLSWRAYQEQLKRAEKNAAQKRIIRRHLKLILPLIAVSFAVYVSITGSFGSLFYHPKEAPEAVKNQRNSSEKEGPLFFSKDEIRHFFDSSHISNLDDNSFEIQNNGKRLLVQTSIDQSLQNYLVKKLDRKNSSQIGIVAMDPEDGRILALVGYDRSDPQNNPCLDSSFPAASIFKIITAAAALEKGKLRLDSKLQYNGGKYTLYKSQLKEKTNKYTNKISLKDAFAKSVNPVFGKLGSLYLGKEELESYARAFGFNRPINFEIFLSPSPIVLTDEPYQWAEIASGFNRQTKMSPVHGALISATIFNQGRLIEPTIVDRIVDEKGVALYQSQPATINQAFAPDTSDELDELMKATIRSGTVRGAFRKYRRDKIISRLEIGGKTGTINNKTDDVKYEWFVGYAQDRTGDAKLILSVLVAHEKYIGIRAAQYAIMAFKKYFKKRFAEMDQPFSPDPS